MYEYIIKLFKFRNVYDKNSMKVNNFIIILSDMDFHYKYLTEKKLFNHF